MANRRSTMISALKFLVLFLFAFQPVAAGEKIEWKAKVYYNSIFEADGGGTQVVVLTPAEKDCSTIKDAIDIVEIENGRANAIASLEGPTGNKVLFADCTLGKAGTDLVASTWAGGEQIKIVWKGLKYPRCGVRGEGKKHRIINGEVAGDHEFPWMVSLRDKNKKYVCGGSILNEKWILTAAHCVAEINVHKALLFGSLDYVLVGWYEREPVWDDVPELERTKLMKISDRLLHPEWIKNRNRDYDVALIKLENAIDFSAGESAHVRQICLPTADFGLREEDQCFLSGFGRISENPELLPSTLRFAKTNCRDYKKLEISCGGSDGSQNGCLFDSGSPLFCSGRVGAHFVQMGITSKGSVHSCGGAAFHMKVPLFINWIIGTIEQIGPNDLAFVDKIVMYNRPGDANDALYPTGAIMNYLKQNQCNQIWEAIEAKERDLGNDGIIIFNIAVGNVVKCTSPSSTVFDTAGTKCTGASSAEVSTVGAKCSSASSADSEAAGSDTRITIGQTMQVTWKVMAMYTECPWPPRKTPRTIYVPPNGNFNDVATAVEQEEHKPIYSLAIGNDVFTEATAADKWPKELTPGSMFSCIVFKARAYYFEQSKDIRECKIFYVKQNGDFDDVASAVKELVPSLHVRSLAVGKNMFSLGSDMTAWPADLTEEKFGVTWVRLSRALTMRRNDHEFTTATVEEISDEFQKKTNSEGYKWQYSCNGKVVKFTQQSQIMDIKERLKNGGYVDVDWTRAGKGRQYHVSGATVKFEAPSDFGNTHSVTHFGKDGIMLDDTGTKITQRTFRGHIVNSVEAQIDQHLRQGYDVISIWTEDAKSEQIWQSYEDSTKSWVAIQKKDINAIGFSFLKKAVEKTQIRRIDFKNCLLKDQGAWVLAKALKTNKDIKNLAFVSNEIGVDGAVHLAEAFKANKIHESLSFGNNHIQNDGSAAIASVLEANDALKKLYLYGNQITDDGAKSLAEALEGNKALQELSLYNNQIKDVGALAFAKALKKNDVLSTFNLAENQIGDNGAVEIALALETNQGLMTLSLRDNGIKDDGAVAIAKAIEINTGLRTLWFKQQTQFGNRAKEALTRAEERRHELGKTISIHYM